MSKVNMLGLGSIILVDDSLDKVSKKFVIIARAIKKGDKDNILARYRVAPHPFGDVPSQEILTVNEDQIKEVIFEGYLDDSDDNFVSDLVGKLSSIKSEVSVDPKQVQVVEKRKVEVEKTVPKTEVSQENSDTNIIKDAFYKFR